MPRFSRTDSNGTKVDAEYLQCSGQAKTTKALKRSGAETTKGAGRITPRTKWYEAGSN